MKAMVRVNALTLTGSGNKALSTMERHGLREDATSKKREVRKVEPLVYGTLELTKAYEAHVEGCKMNSALQKPAMHALIQYPTEIPINAKTEKIMLDGAIRFINESFGGNAVFAARLDRDEAGRHNVDVFFSPKYEKQTKNRKGEAVSTTWISTTKHGKEHCEKHREEIMSRNEEGKFSTTPRSCGIALQSELHEFMAGQDLPLEPKTPKDTYGNDRLEVEALKRVRDEEAAALQRIELEKVAALKAITDEEQRRNQRIDVAEDQVTLDRAKLNVEKSTFETVKERALQLVQKLGEQFGLPLPKKIADAVQALEDMLEEQAKIVATDAKDLDLTAAELLAAAEDPFEEPDAGCVRNDGPDF